MEEFDWELQAKVKVMHQKKWFECLFKTLPLDRLCSGFKFFSVHFSQYFQSYFDKSVTMCIQKYIR